MTPSTAPLVLARKVADRLAALPQVEAIALGGSQVGSMADASSDIDLYVFTRDEIPLADRERVVQEAGGASRASLGLTFWGPGDEWFDAASGIEVDLVYFDVQWLAAELERVLGRQQPALGYTTCLWHTVRSAHSLHDPNGWLAAQQAFSRQPYPEGLCRNIVAFNHPVLRHVIPAYMTQLQKAVQRGDLVSVNHRLAALLASYFDVIFAVNRLPHPGEKRLIAKAVAHCPSLPVNMAEDVVAVLRAAALPGAPLIVRLTQLLDQLDLWLMQAGFDVPALPGGGPAPAATPPPPAANRAIHQGDIYWAAPASAAEGQPGNPHAYVPHSYVPHPYVIVQDDLLNHSRLHTVAACALTTNIGRAGETPGNVLLAAGEANLPRPSVVEVSKLSSLEKAQLGEYIGSLSQQRIDQILAGIRFFQRAFYNR